MIGDTTGKKKSMSHNSGFEDGSIEASADTHNQPVSHCIVSTAHSSCLLGKLLTCTSCNYVIIAVLSDYNGSH